MDMNRSKFDLYFFYYNRKKIRDSIFLEIFPKQFKDFFIKSYIIGKYKLVDKYIIISKLFLFSLFYYILYKATYIPDDIALVIPYTIYVFISFFGTLILLGYNKNAIPDILHDNYFRMLGDDRNYLVKEVMNRRIDYSFTNWIIPFTLFPFIYASIIGGLQYIILYCIFTVFLYLITKIIIFISQRIIYDYVKDIFIIDSIVFFTFLSFILASSLALTIIPVFTVSVIMNFYIKIAINAVVYSFLLIILIYFKRKVVSSSLNYSLTNSMILKRKTRVKTNQIKNPNMFLRIVFGKNDFQNKLLTKDLVTFYRKSKQDFVTMIIMGGISVIYSAMLISSTFSSDSIAGDTMIIDNVFIVLVSTFFVSNLYKMKDSTWYSSEGINLLVYSKMGFDKYSIFKEKQKLNYLILAPLVLLYIVLPLFFIFNMELVTIGYIILRIPLLYLYFTNIIDYSLLQDVYYPRKNKYDVVSGIGSMNMIIIIIMIQGIGISYLLLNASKISNLLGGTINIGSIIFICCTIFMIILKIKNKIMSKKLIGKMERGRIYG